MVAVDVAAAVADEATGLVAVDVAAAVADDATGLVLEAGAALLTVDATVGVVADVADTAEAVGGGVVLAAAVDVPDAGAVVRATAVVAGATAGEVVAAAAPETDEGKAPADAAEIGLTTAAMLSTRTNAQILRCRRCIAYRTAPSSKPIVIVGDPLSLAPERAVKT